MRRRSEDITVVLSLLTICILLAAAGDSAFPQPLGPGLEAISSNLNAVEETLSTIETSGQIEPDALTIGSKLDAFGDDAMVAYRQVNSEAKKYSETHGAQGNLKGLNDFEQSINESRRRLENIIRRMADIDGKIRTGEVMFSESVLKELKTDEIGEFRRTLTPEADKKYRDRFPRLFAGNVSHLSAEEWQAGQVQFKRDYAGRIESNTTPRRIIGEILDALVPDANAAVGIGCYSICVSSAGTACAQCLAASGVAAYAMYESYRKCRKNCCSCKWYKPWCCICRGACLVAFLALLA